MPIYLITGLPGHGKTQYTIDYVERFRQSENKDNDPRPVRYHNINEFKGDWEQMDDPAQWIDSPKGSIVVIDEAQDYFPVLKIGEVKPPYYQQLAKHRHHGFDIFLITQDPGLIDAFVRKLADHHHHLKRKFGKEIAVVHKSQGGVLDVRKELYKSDKSIYKYKPEIQEKYKSATIHTVKKSYPKKLFFFPAAILIFGLIFMFGLNVVDGLGKKKSEVEKVADQIIPETYLDQEAPQLMVPDKKMNYLGHGVLSGNPLHLVATIEDQQYFWLNGMLLPGESLRRLGYEYTLLDECIVIIGRTTITCPPEIQTAKQVQVRKAKNGGTGGLTSRQSPARNQQTQLQPSQMDPNQYGSVSAMYSAFKSNALSNTKIGASATN